MKPGHSAEGRPALHATARVRLPDGRILFSQADGGSGHSGRRSPDIHLGLGSYPAGHPVAVELRWRDGSGHAREERIELKPGWHTVFLGEASDAGAGDEP